MFTQQVVCVVNLTMFLLGFFGLSFRTEPDDTSTMGGSRPSVESTLSEESTEVVTSKCSVFSDISSTEKPGISGVR